MKAGVYSYFDEAYFQDGAKRGTAYSNYKEGARNSPTFRDIALSVWEVFEPRRVLEIGCATGNIVRHLNDLGCEAHGIDVSEWAVRNAEHPNVRLASAEQLPFPDDYFDLVLSCHSLEHLPDRIFDKAIAEMTRVSSGFQFHMLPIIGEPPYDGDPDDVRQQLRKDPTHVQLHELSWWLSQFERYGHTSLDSSVFFRHDTPTVELSTGQFMLKQHLHLDHSQVLRRATRRNARLYRESCLRQPANGLTIPEMGSLSYQSREWKEVSIHSPQLPMDFSATEFHLAVMVSGERCCLRFAAGQDVASVAYGNAGEYYINAAPGFNFYHFTIDDFRTLRGAPDYTRITRCGLGGQNERAEIAFYFADQTGKAILSV